MTNVIKYRVFNADGLMIGEAETATLAGEMLGLDAMFSGMSQKVIQVTLSNVGGQFAWTDTRLPTASLIPLLKIEKIQK